MSAVAISRPSAHVGTGRQSRGIRASCGNERETAWMSTAQVRMRVATHDVVWYLNARLTDAERMDYATATSGVVLRGASGCKAATNLRAAGFHGRIWIDPAAYDQLDQPQPDTLFGDYWQLRQEELSVEEPISPGAYVGAGDIESLQRSLDSEGSWVSEAGGRLSLALRAGWLTDHVERLIAEMQAADLPFALAFADSNDPLGRRGAVPGLVELLKSVNDVVILRCDVGAVGAVAHGASLGALGTSTGVRHAVPPGHQPGGAANDKSPSVFLPKLLDFKLGSLLDSFPRAASPTCELECCQGAPLRRLNDQRMNAEARRHNRLAISELIHKVAATEQPRRAQVFKSLCIDAEHEAHELSGLARRPLRVRPQVAAWARL